MNGLFRLLSPCTAMLIRKSELPTATINQLMFQSVPIKGLCYVNLFLSLLWKVYHMSSELDTLGAIICRLPCHCS